MPFRLLGCGGYGHYDILHSGNNIEFLLFRVPLVK